MKTLLPSGEWLSEVEFVDRYEIGRQLGSGGMASVHMARLIGDGGFSRAVAIKRMHDNYAHNPEFVEMFLNEARVASGIHHPNVVAPLDVVLHDGQLFIVMEYVQGKTLSQLMAATRDLPVHVVMGIVAQALHGLHAAHDATDVDGTPLQLVHCDVSPQNIIVGIDGVARVLDFGVAKATLQSTSTHDRRILGKIAYMAPEQIDGEPLDRRADVFAAGVVAWEALTGRKLFAGSSDVQTIARVLAGAVSPIVDIRPDVPAALDACIRRALCANPDERHATALDFAEAIEQTTSLATNRMIGEWVQTISRKHSRPALSEDTTTSAVERAGATWSEARSGAARRMRHRLRPRSIPAAGVVFTLFLGWALSAPPAGAPSDPVASQAASTGSTPAKPGASGPTELPQSEAIANSGHAPHVASIPDGDFEPEPANDGRLPSREQAADEEKGEADDSGDAARKRREARRSKRARREAARDRERAAARRRRAHRQESRRERTEATCATPYTIDEHGIKRVKMECL